MATFVPQFLAKSFTLHVAVARVSPTDRSWGFLLIVFNPALASINRH